MKIDNREVKLISVTNNDINDNGTFIFPDNITSIGDYAFYGCSSLTSITISNSVTSIGDYAFEWCESLTSVTIPNSVISIGDLAFYECSRLTSIIIPDSVTSIGGLAFYGTPWLENKQKANPLVIVNGILIDGKTCSGKVTIPNSVTSIGDSAFNGCKSLTSITIPDTVTSIGASAFYECKSLTSVTIPNSVTSIGDYAFDRCPKFISKCSNYKAFNLVDGKLMCRDYEFNENEWSDELDDIELCERGYHYCTNLFEIFNYYYGEIDKDIAIYECEVGDEVIKSSTSKCVTNKIKPVKRLYQKDIIRILNVSKE